jgi:hypothetical protein
MFSQALFRALLLIAALSPAAARAQQSAAAPMMHGGAMMAPGEMTHTHRASTRAGSMPTEAGQSAFAAIQEIVAILEADPNTDWSKVDIDALRQHLVDMNAVTLETKVANAPVEGGERFDVTGDGAVSDSIRRMLIAHAATMSGVDGWTFEAHPIAGGASLTVHAPPKDVAKLKGLGFFGVLTLGMHHQMHHLMLARGHNPHE